MGRWKKLLNELLFPHICLVILLVPVSAAALCYVFFNSCENEPIAYITYVLSAYALTVLCIRLVQFIRYARCEADALVEKYPIVGRFIKDIPFRLKFSLYASFGFNSIYAIWKFFYGVYLRSIWFGALAVYYFLLAVMRLMLIKHSKQNEFGENRREEQKKYMYCGIMLLVMNIALAVVVILVVRANKGFSYPGYLIYVMALYTFCNVVSACYNLIKYRQYQSPVMSAAKVISLASALVSLLSLETAMLEQFGEGDNSEQLRLVMTASTGGMVCAMIFAIAVYMITRSVKELKADKGEMIE